MIDFTKIIWAGEDCILVTDRVSRATLFLLTRHEIERMMKEFNKKLEEGKK